MKDRYRIVLVADTHVGMDAFSSTPAEWDSPFREAVQYAVDVDADAFLIAGDAYHKRNPTMAEHERMADILDPLARRLTPVIVAAGNHDIGQARDSVCAGAFMYGEWYEGGFMSVELNGLQLLPIPWPRPSAFHVKASDPEEAIIETRGKLLHLIEQHSKASAREPGPVVAFGHAMVSYSGAPDFVGGGEEAVTQSMPPDPGLIQGKDVMLPYEWLRDTIPGPLFLGHVHDPEQPGYVGSTQPTDWGEAGQQKRFYYLQIERCNAGSSHPYACHRLDNTGVDLCLNGWHYDVKSIPYTTTLRIHHLQLDWSGGVPSPWDCNLDVVLSLLEVQPYSIRADITVPEGSDVTPHEIRAILAQHCRKVGPVNVTPVRRHSARVETETPLVRQPVPDGVKTWLESRDEPQDKRDAALAALDDILPEVTEG